AMGHDTAQQVQSMVEKAGATKEGLFANIAGIIAIVFGAMGVFVELQKSLNTIWGVKQKPNLGFINIVKERVFSFGLIISIGFLLLVSLLVSSALAAASHKLAASFSGAATYLFYVLEFVVSLSVIAVLFALMFKVLPDVKMKWRNVWIGAGLTAILFTMGKYAISFYFGKAQPASVYGAAGSVILILLWVSYSSLIVFFGAEFTKQYALYHGIEIAPDKNAVMAGPAADTGAPGSPKPLQAEHQQEKTNDPVKPDPRS
ncbi:MAG: YihY/virulence factor BrkB family protein, partial [Bacteroidia bacterium]